MAQVSAPPGELAGSVPALVRALIDRLPKPDGRSVLNRKALVSGLARIPTAVASLPPSRLAGVRAGTAAALLAVLAVALVWALALSFRPESGSFVAAADPTQGDAALYRAIVERVAGGEDYYHAVVAEHRSRNYPLRPVLTVRLPSLAILQAWLGSVGAVLLLACLSFVAALATIRRLVAEAAGAKLLGPIAALALYGLGQGIILPSAVWHEAWAAVFIVLSLALRTPERWAVSVLLGIAAVIFREMALAYLCVMAFAAFVELRWREGVAWLFAITTFALVLLAHVNQLAPLVGPDDLVSPGWLQVSGWTFVLSMLGNCSMLAAFPLPVLSVLVVLALLGWLAWPGAFSARAAFLLTGYAAVFMIVGRRDNVYWGLLWGPLVPLGLAFAPSALRDLWQAVLRRPVPTALPSAG